MKIRPEQITCSLDQIFIKDWFIQKYLYLTKLWTKKCYHIYQRPAATIRAPVNTVLLILGQFGAKTRRASWRPRSRTPSNVCYTKYT